MRLNTIKTELDMQTDKKLFILIPAYNEEKKIGLVISNLKLKGYHNILVIDDGSHDHTEEIAINAGAEVLSHIINRGQGAALRTGIEYLRENRQPDIIVTFDADGQHRVEDLQALLNPLDEGFDIALGSRFLDNKTKMPRIKRIVLGAGIIFTNIISNIKLTDTHNGLRALGIRAINKIDITQRGMEHASEIIDEIIKKKLKYKEIPVEIIYTEYSMANGQSAMSFLKLGLKFILKKITD
jgi:glycosyltransferase involved in cell wall biosynthesis